MKKASIQRNALLSTMYQALTMVTPLITAPYTARVLGAEGIGIYSFTNSIQNYFLLFAVLGTYIYAGREIARNRDDEAKRSHLFWEIQLLTTITSGLCLLGWGVVIALGGSNRIYYAILSLNLIAVMLDITWFFSGMERYDYIVLTNSVVKILVITSVFLFVKTKEDLPRYILVFSLGALLSQLPLWFFLPRYIQKPNWKEIRIFGHFKRTLVYFVPTIASSVYTVLDKTLIGMIMQDNAQSGYYEQATKIINIAKSVAFVALTNVMSTRLSYLYAHKDQEGIRKTTDSAMGYVSFMSIGITFGIAVVAPDLVLAFFGPEYTEVVSLLRLFSPIVSIVGLSSCTASCYYIPAGLQAKNSKIVIIGAGVNLVFNCILIPRFESKGAVIGSIIAEMVMLVLCVAFSNGVFSLEYLVRNIWKKMVAAVAMVVVILPIAGLIGNPILTLVCQIPAGVMVYSIVLMVLHDDFVTPVLRSGIKKMKGKLMPKSGD